MRRGKAVLALGVLAGATALGLGGSMAAKRQPLPLPARYDLREDGAGPWIRDQGDQNTCWAFASVTALETSMKEEERIPSPSGPVRSAGGRRRAMDPGSGGPEHLLGVCVGNGPGDFHEGGRTDPVLSGPQDP